MHPSHCYSVVWDGCNLRPLSLVRLLPPRVGLILQHPAPRDDLSRPVEVCPGSYLLSLLLSSTESSYCHMIRLNFATAVSSLHLMNGHQQIHLLDLHVDR